MAEMLNNRYFLFNGKQGKEKNYFKDYPEKNSKRYKLVWWWWKEVDSYLWVRTCHPIKINKKKIAYKEPQKQHENK